MRTFFRCPNLAVAELAPILRLVESVGLICIAAVVVVMAVPTKLAAQETISLFNSNDLTGWTIHGTELWYVEDGELVGESRPDAAYGYLATEASFKDFELTLEFLQMVFAGPDGDLLDVGKYLAVWQKIEGEWYVVALSFTSDAPAPVPIGSD